MDPWMNVTRLYYWQDNAQNNALDIFFSSTAVNLKNGTIIIRIIFFFFSWQKGIVFLNFIKTMFATDEKLRNKIDLCKLFNQNLRDAVFIKLKTKRNVFL